MSVYQKSSRDPAVISPPLEQWQSNAVRLSSGDGEVSYHCAVHDGVIAAAVSSQIDMLEHFSPSPDSLYLAIIDHAPDGSMIDGLKLPGRGLLVLHGGREHVARTLPGSRWTELTVPLAMLEHNQIDPDPLLRRLRKIEFSLTPYVGPAAGDLRGLLYRALAGQTSAPLDGPNGVTALLLAAVSALNEWSDRPPAKLETCRTGYYRVINRALDFIEGSYAGDIGLPDIAGYASCSPRQLQKAFTSVLGTTPLRYTKARRLARVRQLLLRPGGNAVSVSEAAGAAGFHHRGHFSADYRQYFGELPAASIVARR